MNFGTKIKCMYSSFIIQDTILRIYLKDLIDGVAITAHRSDSKEQKQENGLILYFMVLIYWINDVDRKR